ncbi:MAG TPA: NlpC/P60 family protein, partial [Flavisolibacter sp.]|nr:NlpC/P60 family protein [Flavisolibacter sp.]
MKWIIVILLIFFAGWKAAIFLLNKNVTGDSLTVASLPQVRQTLIDTNKTDSARVPLAELDTIKKHVVFSNGSIDTRNVQPQQIVDFAKTLIGVPYLYGSTDPAKGFDCSGFITYVFNRFNIAVPRSSIDFTSVGKEVTVADSKEADLILFTGTDSLKKFVGHMGIVVSNTDSLYF